MKKKEEEESGKEEGKTWDWNFNGIICLWCTLGLVAL
jgi:hypothetical protein